MSTKTTFKRVAAVAALALTLGGLSSVSAIAAGPSADAAAKLGIDAGSGDGGVAGIAGPANSIVVNAFPKAVATGTHSYGAFVTVSGAGATILSSGQAARSTNTETSTVSVSAETSSTGVVASSGASMVLVGSDSTDLIHALKIGTPTAGTITVNLYNATTYGANPSAYNTTADATLSITVNAAGVANVLNVSKSLVYGDAADETTAGNVTSTTDAAFSVSSASASASTTPVATFKVVQNDGNGNALTSGYKSVSVTTTIGAVQSTHNTNAGSYVAASAAATQLFWLAPDGRSGVATVTIAINGVTAKTFTVTFVSSTIASFTPTVLHSYVKYGTAADYTAPTSTTSPTIVVVTKDANGNDNSSAGSITAKSSDTTIATVAVGSYNSTAGGIAVNVTGVAAGTVTITIQDTAAALTAQTVTVNVSKAVVSTITAALDSDAYAAGAKATLTVTAKDSAGSPVADGTYANLLATGGFTASQSITSDLSATSLKFVGGVATLTFYAPGANFSVNATTGSSTSVLSSALQSTAATLTAAATVTTAAADAAAAAIDAAQEATDAANAAYDAANNAMDSADAATAAAQDASDNASQALAAVTALSATVAKLVASVNSIAVALAKIQKKLKA